MSSLLFVPRSKFVRDKIVPCLDDEYLNEKYDNYRADKNNKEVLSVINKLPTNVVWLSNTQGE